MKNSKLKPKPKCYILIAFVILLSNLNANATAQNFTYIYRDYLRNMMNMMDSKLQPCDDFFQHACGNFNKVHHLGSVTESSIERDQIVADQDVVPFLYNNQDRYMFFESHKQYFGTIPGILVRNVYELCKATLKHNSSKRKLWLKMIKELTFLKHDHDLLRKWPFLEYQWEKYEERLDLIWPVLAAEFSAHGLNTFIKVYFAENTLYVAPNDGLNCPENENDVRTSLLPLLRQRNAQIADIIGGEIWVLCHQLMGEIAFSGEIIQNSTNFLAYNAIMDKFFQRLFPRLNIVEPEVEYARKVFIHVDKLAEIISLLGLTNPRIVYNFIIWQAYQQITSIDDCFNLIHEFDSLLDVEYWNWHAFNQHFRREVALASYLFHTTRFQKHYRYFITSTSVERLFQNRSERKDLNIERIIKNYAKQYLNRDTYSNVYKTALFSTEPSTFYSLLFEFRRLKLRYTFLHPTGEHLEDINFFKEFLNFSILLLYRPRLHYFASYDREFWENSKILQSSDGFYAAEDCLERQTTLNSEDSKLYENLTENQVDEIFNFYTAFTEALSDYKFWLESENFAIAEDFILEYFKLNSTRVLFYAVAQQYCSRNDVLHRHLINRSYMNMPDFQEAFSCQPNDEMNPITKCMVNQCQSAPTYLFTY